ncbi:MAG: ABC transporter substrate-binding protein [Cytophagales bacterium]|nr:ABC transporter substrate-binding protein [Cytophagales bacterium]
MKRYFFSIFLTASALLSFAQTAPEAPDALVRRLAVEVTDAVKSDKALATGDVTKVAALIDAKVIPFVNFQRMTASSVGPAWRSATPEQQKRLQEEFKMLLVRTYAGAVKEIKDQTVTVKPLKAAPEDTSVIVRSEVRGKGDPVQLDYRVGKVQDGANSVWKIHDINILGVWLVETYRGQFSQEINANGIDGLIKSLTEKNKGVKK